MEDRWRLLAVYAVALAATAAAVFVSWLLNPQMGHRLPFVTVYGAVAVGGWGPALAATVLGHIATDAWFIEGNGGQCSPTGIGGVVSLTEVARAKTVFWNGHMRIFEAARFDGHGRRPRG